VAIVWKKLRKIHIKHCTVGCRVELEIWTWCNRETCRLQLDIGSGATESFVNFNWTMEVVQRRALSTSTRHWPWCKGNLCRLQLDIGPGATESAVDGQRSGGGRHSIPGCKTIAAWSWFLRMRRVTPSLHHMPAWRAHGYVFPLLLINPLNPELNY